MRSGVSGFSPRRLEQGRRYLGLTKTAFARLVGVSAATMSNWANGKQTPEEKRLNRLAELLQVDPGWFLTDPQQQQNSPIFFRSLASTKAQARESVGVLMAWQMEVADKLGHYVNWPEVKLPDYRFTDPLSITEAYIIEAADAFRAMHDLGDAPIEDMVLALENAGVIVSRAETGYESMDALSAWDEKTGRPFVLLSADKASGPRARFDAAHELGHLILHRHIDIATFKKHHKLLEQQANLFAGYLLMPESAFVAELRLPVTLDNLKLMKPRWKVSISAMIMRLHAIGMVSDMDRTRLFKNLSARKWRTTEPLDDTIRPERPRLLHRAVRLINDSGVLDRKGLLHKMGLPQPLVEQLCALPASYFDNNDDTEKVIPLRLRQQA